MRKKGKCFYKYVNKYPLSPAETPLFIRRAAAKNPFVFNKITQCTLRQPVHCINKPSCAMVLCRGHMKKGRTKRPLSE
jgi:hypothetical protein